MKPSIGEVKEAIERLENMEQCTCNNPTIICRYCEAVITIRSLASAYVSGTIGEYATRTEIIDILKKLAIERIHREYDENTWVDFSYEASGLLIGKVARPVERGEKCPFCSGVGANHYENVCHHCHGTGKRKE